MPDRLLYAWHLAVMNEQQWGEEGSILQLYLYYITKWYNATCFGLYRKPSSDILKYLKEECLQTTQWYNFNIFKGIFFLQLFYNAWRWIYINAGTSRIVSLVMLWMCLLLTAPFSTDLYFTLSLSLCLTRAPFCVTKEYTATFQKFVAFFFTSPSSQTLQWVIHQSGSPINPFI